MDAKIKCSNCGAEISNLSMSWNWKKQWYWFIIAFIPAVFIFTVTIPGLSEKADASEFSFEGLRIEKTDEYVFVRGSVTNNGDNDWGSITLEIEFYDNDGKFIDEISEYMSGGLLSKAKENFKMSAKCDHVNIDGYSEYKVRVVDTGRY